jgi:hypothetical protein
VLAGHFFNAVDDRQSVHIAVGKSYRLHSGDPFYGARVCIRLMRVVNCRIVFREFPQANFASAKGVFKYSVPRGGLARGLGVERPGGGRQASRVFIDLPPYSRY